MSDLTGESRSDMMDDSDVFRRCYSGLRRFAGVVAPLDLEPDDVVQDALVATLRRHRLIDLENPEAYLRRVIVNQVSNQRRRMGRRRNAERLLVASTHPARQTYPSDLSDLMWLTPRQRAVLFLCEVEGFSFDEVGSLLGCSAPAARMAATRARRRLRSAIGEGAVT